LPKIRIDVSKDVDVRNAQKRICEAVIKRYRGYLVPKGRDLGKPGEFAVCRYVIPKIAIDCNVHVKVSFRELDMLFKSKR